MIWNRFPKTVFVGAEVLNFGAYDAVAHSNIGNKAAVNILSQLGLVPGQYFEQNMLKANKQQVKKAEHRNTPAIRKRRKILYGQKKKKDDKKRKQRAPHMKQLSDIVNNKIVRPYDNLDPIVLMVN
jgi:hypothetical protein